MTSRQSYSVARQQMLLSQTNPVGIELFSYVNIFSGGSFFWVKKNKSQKEEKPARQAKQNLSHPLTQGLDPPLTFFGPINFHGCWSRE